MRRPGLLPLVGVLVGALTSYAQQWLDSPWASLANSASPWLTVAWVVGRYQRGTRGAAVAGAVTCVGEVVGYYGVSAARGFGVSESYLVFWVVAALVGGPIFGACGRLARGAQPRFGASLGAAAVPATFLGEGVGSYVIRLGYAGDAAVFVVFGVLTSLVALVRLRPRLVTGALIVVGALGGLLLYGGLLTVLG